MRLDLLKDESLIILGKVYMNPRFEFSQILREVADISLTDQLLDEFAMISDEKTKLIQDAVRKFADGVPLQYITGKTEFMGLPIEVNENVLIPRPDTECIVERALNLISSESDVLDLCSGSGCIGIALKKIGKCKTITFSDISASALEICKKNCQLNNTDACFIQGDLFENINDKYDLIISNPPYIKTEEIEKLETNVKDHEPRIALDGGNDGLDFYRRIIKDAPKYLKPGGRLIFEIGFDQAEKIRELINLSGNFSFEAVYEDYGRNTRGIYAKLK